MQTDLQRARRWCRRQFNLRRPERTHEHASHLAAEILREAEKRYDLGTFGDERWCCDCAGRRGVTYLNAGDSYAETLAFKSDQCGVTFCVTSWEMLALNRNWRPEQ
jgi:hypothetical protein